ncbi:MAG: DUF2953 domain-containing protein [Clostridia bacterium]|nr:DUF2953 domain-containing protein [Clostridia bacterium]
MSFIFELKEEFSFKVKVLFITLNADRIAKLIPSDKKEAKIPEKTEALKKKHKKKSFSDIIETLAEVVDLVKAIFKELLRYARLKVCYLDMKLATEDAANTALLYGAVSSAVYAAVEFLDNFITLKKSYKKIAVYPDFAGTETKVNFKIVISIKPIHVLLAAMHVLPVLAEKQKGK